MFKWIKNNKVEALCLLLLAVIVLAVGDADFKEQFGDEPVVSNTAEVERIIDQSRTDALAKAESDRLYQWGEQFVPANASAQIHDRK